MKQILYIKRGTFITQQGFIQASLLLVTCIGIPVLLLLTNEYSLMEFIRKVFSSVESSIVFITIISVPIITFVIVIWGNIYDYCYFKKNPKGIKAISLNDTYICLHCNQTAYDRALSFSEITQIFFKYKQAIFFDASAISKGIKLGGIPLATVAGNATASKLIYEVEISIIDKNNEEYIFTIPAQFSNNPYSEMQKVKNFFENKNIKISVNINNKDLE